MLFTSLRARNFCSSCVVNGNRIKRTYTRTQLPRSSSIHSFWARSLELTRLPNKTQIVYITSWIAKTLKIYHHWNWMTLFKMNINHFRYLHFCWADFWHCVNHQRRQHSRATRNYIKRFNRVLVIFCYSYSVVVFFLAIFISIIVSFRRISHLLLFGRHLLYFENDTLSILSIALSC